MKLRGFFFTVLCSLCIASTFLGCGKPGGSSNNLTNSFVTVVSVNGNAPLVSDVLTDGAGTDDIVTITFQGDSRRLGSDDNPTDPDGFSPFDTITLRSYHVEHIRSDGGPNPADFTAGTNVVIQPDGEGEADVVVVRAFDKHRSPLEELRDDGQIFTTSIITFYGEDGYGNDISVDASLVISFANYPDQ